MGWSSGTPLMRKIIRSTQAKVSDAGTRQALYTDFIGAFEDADWDNLDEAMGVDPAFDAAVRSLYPNAFEED